MARPLMPKATAVWLVDNTALTFDQIADFCGLHPLEIQAIADGEVAVGMQGLDPIRGGELTADEIERCEADPTARLAMAAAAAKQADERQKKSRYTPVSKRQDRPDAIAWLLRNYPELTDAQISKLIGTTKPTINSVRDRTHWNAANIKPQNPVGLGLCSSAELEKAIAVARAKSGTVHAPAAEAKAAEAPAPDSESAGSEPEAGASATMPETPAADTDSGDTSSTG